MVLSRDPKVPVQTGSIADVYRRLTLWCQQASEGFARVDYLSEFSKEKVIQQLEHTLGIPFLKISLNREGDARELIQSVIEQMKEFGEGIVSLDGLTDLAAEEILRQVDLFREQIALPNIRQIWWIGEPITDYLVDKLPDLNSWFMQRLKLDEIIFHLSEEDPLDFAMPSVDLEAAQQRSQEWLARFAKAKAEGSPSYQLAVLAQQAVVSLYRAGGILEAQQLTQQLLPELIMDEDPQDSASLQGLLAVAELYRILGEQQRVQQIIGRIYKSSPELLDARHLAGLRYFIPYIGMNAFVGRNEELKLLDFFFSGKPPQNFLK